jgi:hypothetical protein
MTMPRLRFTAALLVSIWTAPLIALGAPSAPPPETVQQNPELFSWVFGLVTAALLFFIAFKVHSDHQNNKEQWTAIKDNRDKIHGVDKDLAELRGQHTINHSPEFKR